MQIYYAESFPACSVIHNSFNRKIRLNVRVLFNHFHDTVWQSLKANSSQVFASAEALNVRAVKQSFLTNDPAIINGYKTIKLIAK